MVKKLNGQRICALIDYGVRSLSIHQEYVNDLNVFPVPDGDTGTNMVLTLSNGHSVMASCQGELPEMARAFAKAVVFGARGNSGVIVSQFFKGTAEYLFDTDQADIALIVSAFENGVRQAYAAVSTPVEGTMLTVMRESTEQARLALDAGEISDFGELFTLMHQYALESLAHTPELLPVLKSAGVVDSGGAGFVFVLEGMKKYLAGEPLAAVQISSGSMPAIDYSRFGRTDTFPLGYCTELLLQLLDSKQEFEMADFEAQIAEMGDSLALVLEGDKLKVHIHTCTPEQILTFCHRFGEFLSLKIENMSVQHSQQEKDKQKKPRVVYEAKCQHFSVVAVAHDPSMEQRFLDMGADAVIRCEQANPPSTQDFLEIFERMESNSILVFPNGKNIAFAAEQAKALYKDGEVVVFHTTSDAACYAALPMINFDEEDIHELGAQIQKTLDNALAISVAIAQKTTSLDGVEIKAGQYVAYSNSSVIAAHASRRQAAILATDRVMADTPYDVLTIFCGAALSEEVRDAVGEHLATHYPYTEVDFLETENDFYSLVLYFE